MRRPEAGAALALLGPASLLMLLTLVVPLGFMLRDSLNRFDPTEMMIAAVTPENYLRFFDRSVLSGVLVHDDPRLGHRYGRVPGVRPADGLAPGAQHQPLEIRRWWC